MTLPVTPPAGVPMIRIEQLAEQPHFVRLQPLHGVRVDLRYVGSNNFAGRSLYGSLDCAWLRREAAAGLQAAAQWLHARRLAFEHGREMRRDENDARLRMPRPNGATPCVQATP